jgi:ABC-type uncharacterized transport system permease subunit
MIFWIIIGSTFYNLATKYGKNKWKYLGIGIGLAIAVQLLVGLIYGLIFQPSEEELDKSSLAVNVVALLISGIAVYFSYQHLKNKAESGEDELLTQIEKIGEEKKEDSMEL